MTGLVGCVLFLLHLQRYLCAINEDTLTLTCCDGVKISGSKSMLEMFYDARGNSEYSFYEMEWIHDLSGIKELDASSIVLENDLSFVEKLVSVEKLKMRVSGPGIALLNGLLQIQSLRELNLCGSDFTDLLDLGFFARLASLVKLGLSSCKLTSASLNTLSEIESLRELNLCVNNFTDLLDFGFIAKLPSLEKLSLSFCRLKSASLKALSEIETHKSLRELDLYGNNLSDLSDLAFIAKLPLLVKLNLGNCRLTSVSLNTLSGIETHENLRELDLYGNNFSDLLDLGSIAKLPSLKELDLGNCSLTPESKSRISELMHGRECDLKLWP